MAQLRWHKLRLVTLGPKIEGLPDDHPSKAQCLYELAQLFYSVGNVMERRRLLDRALKLWKEQGDDFRAARTLCDLAAANHGVDLRAEGRDRQKKHIRFSNGLAIRCDKQIV